MNKEIIKNTLILIAITLVSGILLGLVYDITKEPIANQHAKAKADACKAVFTEADSFDTEHVLDVSNSAKVLKESFKARSNEGIMDYTTCTIDEMIPALNKNKECIGYAITVTCPEGYGGDITFIMGVTLDGTVNGIDFLTLNETAGLGMNAKEPAFAGQFAKKNVDLFSVTKDTSSGDDSIQAISAATITSNAVAKGVNAGLEYFRYVTGMKGGTINE